MGSEFSVVAIIAAFNEGDIIGQVVRDLIEQEIEVYFMDDGSTDDTLEAVERYAGRGVVGVERLSDTAGAAASFNWERILLRKAELAQELDATWFIHHDADEFRESPWPHLSLRAAIERVDRLGFNAIDFALFNFPPVHDGFRRGDDVRKEFQFCEPAAPYDRLQIRCWKKTDHLVDLVSSGGHEVQFPERKVFPLRFILRHYPIRGQAHGERKVFQERRDRFLPEERKRAWHIQYDSVSMGDAFVREPHTLTPYDPDAVRIAGTLRHRGIEELEQSLRVTQSEIERLHQAQETWATALQRYQDQLIRMRSDLSERALEAASLKRQVEGQALELAEALARLQATSVEAQTLRLDLEERGNELEHLRVAVEDRSREVRDLRVAVEERTREVRDLGTAVEERTREVRDLHNSKSWRATRPLRVVYELLSGFRRSC
jgi:hypothetical protein